MNSVAPLTNHVCSNRNPFWLPIPRATVGAVSMSASPVWHGPKASIRRIPLLAPQLAAHAHSSFNTHNFCQILGSRWCNATLRGRLYARTPCFLFAVLERCAQLVRGLSATRPAANSRGVHRFSLSCKHFAHPGATDRIRLPIWAAGWHDRCAVEWWNVYLLHGSSRFFLMRGHTVYAGHIPFRRFAHLDHCALRLCGGDHSQLSW